MQLSHMSIIFENIWFYWLHLILILSVGAATLLVNSTFRGFIKIILGVIKK